MKTFFYFAALVLCVVGCNKPEVEEPDEPEESITYKLVDDCTSLPITDCRSMLIIRKYCCPMLVAWGGQNCWEVTSLVFDCEFSLRSLSGLCDYGTPYNISTKMSREKSTDLNPDKYDYSKIGVNWITFAPNSGNEIRLKPLKNLRLIFKRNPSHMNKILLNPILLEFDYSNSKERRYVYLNELNSFKIDGKYIPGKELKTLRNADHKVTVKYSLEDSVYTESLEFITDCDEELEEVIINY